MLDTSLCVWEGAERNCDQSTERGKAVWGNREEKSRVGKRGKEGKRRRTLTRFSTK